MAKTAVKAPSKSKAAKMAEIKEGLTSPIVGTNVSEESEIQTFEGAALAESPAASLYIGPTEVPKEETQVATTFRALTNEEIHISRKERKERVEHLNNGETRNWIQQPVHRNRNQRFQFFADMGLEQLMSVANYWDTQASSAASRLKTLGMTLLPKKADNTITSAEIREYNKAEFALSLAQTKHLQALEEMAGRKNRAAQRITGEVPSSREEYLKKVDQLELQAGIE